jgi:hypothetical protein
LSWVREAKKNWRPTPIMPASAFLIHGISVTPLMRLYTTRKARRQG